MHLGAAHHVVATMHSTIGSNGRSMGFADEYIDRPIWSHSLRSTGSNRRSSHGSSFRGSRALDAGQQLSRGYRSKHGTRRSHGLKTVKCLQPAWERHGGLELGKAGPSVRAMRSVDSLQGAPMMLYGTPQRLSLPRYQKLEGLLQRQELRESLQKHIMVGQGTQRVPARKCKTSDILRAVDTEVSRMDRCDPAHFHAVARQSL